MKQEGRTEREIEKIVMAQFPRPKKIHLELTEDQADTLEFILSEEVSSNAFTGQSDYVAFISRLRKKVTQAKQLAKAKTSTT